MSNIDLLPRADLPVIWNAFKAQAEEVRQIAETLVVTDVSQKEEMALARKTRLTLKEIRIAVEHKRVELGEGHLKEIQKVNGAARAIREFIEPLEARLLHQEGFAERVEALRIAELSKSRLVELIALREGFYPTDLGTMKQEEYDGYVARIRAEKAEIEAANRLRIEAERRLAEAQAKAERQAASLRAEADIKLAAERAEANRLRVEAEKRLAEQQIEMRRQEEAFLDKLQAEKVAENARLAAEREEYERKAQVAREEAEANARAEATYLRQEQERLRIRDEQIAVLEAELAQERAAKQAEADAARRLALAPDVEQLRGFSRHLQQICKPALKTAEAEACLDAASRHFAQAIFTIDAFVSDRS